MYKKNNITKYNNYKKLSIKESLNYNLNLCSKFKISIKYL